MGGLAGDSSALWPQLRRLHGAGTFTSKLLFSDGWLVGAAVSWGRRWDFWIGAWTHRHIDLSSGCIQRGNWFLRQAVEAAGVVRTWLGNWHSVTSTLFHWSKHLQSPPTSTGRSHGKLENAKEFVAIFKPPRWSFVSLSLSPFHHPLPPPQHVWNYFSIPDTRLSVSTTHEGGGTITHS